MTTPLAPRTLRDRLRLGAGVPAMGGMRGFAAMQGNQPDFFIHSGDGIYADCPIARELKLPDAVEDIETVWGSGPHVLDVVDEPVDGVRPPRDGVVGLGA